MRRPTKTGSKRRFICIDEARGRTPEALKRELNLQRKREYQRQWAKANRDRIKAMAQRDRAKHGAKRAKAKKEWRERNIEYVRRYQALKMREWRRAHPEKAKATTDRWRAKNLEQINAARRARHARKRALQRQLKEAA